MSVPVSILMLCWLNTRVFIVFMPYYGDTLLLFVNGINFVICDQHSAQYLREQVLQDMSHNFLHIKKWREYFYKF